MIKMCLWMVVLEKRLSPRLEVKILVPVLGVQEDRDLATRTALDTPLPFDVPVNKKDGQTARELGYHIVCYYRIEDVRVPQVVAWYY